MRKLTFISFLVIIVILATFFLSTNLIFADKTDKGFDEFGYNDNARIFNGLADGVDRKLDGLLWGDSTYANDHLVMKWNAEWDRGNDEDWANGPYNAWTNNEWNGNVAGGSGEMWVYKIVWIGETASAPEGGYKIWGQFAVILSQGNAGDGHIWDTLATPAGYGAYFE